MTRKMRTRNRAQPRKRAELPVERIYLLDPSDRYSDYPSTNLTPRKLAQIFREADAGDVLRQMELFEEMEEKDTHLLSQMQTRKLAVTGLEWEVHPATDEEKDKEIAEFVSGQLSELEDLDSIFMDLLDAIGKGISVMEILWKTDAGRNVIDDIVHVPAKKLTWASDREEMLLVTKDHPEGLPLPENKFVVHRYKARTGHPARAGVLRVVSWMYLFKNYSLKDWVAFCEVFGMPLRLGRYDPSASDADKRALARALISLGTDAAGIVPSSTSVEFVEASKTTSAEIYESLATYCDRQISKAILGQTLTSDTGAGSKAQGVVHNDVRHDLTVADARSLSTTIRRDIIRPLVEFNFGPDALIPEIKFAYEEEEDQQQAADVLEKLVCRIGLKVPSSYVYGRFNIPKPEDGDEVVTGAPEQPAGSEPAMELKAMKNGSDPQDVVDDIVETAVHESPPAMRQLFAPLVRLSEQAASLEELQEALQDPEVLAALAEQMAGGDLSDLMYRALYVAKLTGRATP